MFYLNREFEIINKAPLLKCEFTEPKEFATLRAQDGSMVEVVIKNVSRHCPPDVVPSEWYLSIWKSYVERGIVTHEWMEIFDENCVIMPNLYADGWSMYGRSSYRSIPMNEFAVPLCERDLLATALNKEEIEARAKTHIEGASSVGIALPYDDPFELMVHDSGNWRIGTLDPPHSQFCAPANAEDANKYNFKQALLTIFLSLEMISKLHATNPKLFENSGSKVLSQPQ